MYKQLRLLLIKLFLFPTCLFLPKYIAHFQILAGCDTTSDFVSLSLLSNMSSLVQTVSILVSSFNSDTFCSGWGCSLGGSVGIE